ncbi:predicted protein [Naegleria gruberi]|uniref:Predicted protein n=1 Tax=Naegleria gruberi TaxID=5762 RepID=D2VQS9_NAEGR|nr:uncharacterized protein NAEGRDRAFT_71334 [Naegleria gruberi]EFC40761.1 predicted protein [Naegleria gruberi]|eukprot:XP_002673505.1 predicted protein [Naegleria gruberi strain NEG-M]
MSKQANNNSTLDPNQLSPVNESLTTLLEKANVSNRKKLAPITQLSSIEWMMILSYGVFKDDLRECLNLFLSNSYIYKVTHEFDWFWKHLIYLLLEEFQFQSKNKKDLSNFGSFIKEIQGCSLLYKRGTHYKHTKHLKKDDNPKLVFLQAWKRVVSSGGSNLSPYFGSGRLNSYLLKIDEKYFNLYTNKRTRSTTETVHLFRDFEGAVKSLEFAKEQVADNAIRYQAYNIALCNTFKNCSYFTQTACNSLIIELDMMFSYFSKTDISFRSRMTPLKALIEKRETFIPIINVACYFYKLAVAKHLKEDNFQSNVMKDISEILSLIQSNRMHKISNEGSFVATVFNFLLAETICEKKYPHTNIIDGFTDVIEFKLDSSNIRGLFGSLFELGESIKSAGKKMSVKVELGEYGLISLISNVDEKKQLFESIVNGDIIYQLTRLDVSKFFSQHYNRLEESKKLLELCIKQNTGNELINSIFDNRLDYGNQSKFINYLFDGNEFEIIKSVRYSLIHALCKQFYLFLKDLDILHEKNPSETIGQFDVLLDNFKNLFTLLLKRGFVQDCRDSTLLNEILSNRLQGFFVDNPDHVNIIVGRIQFLGVKFSALSLLDIERLVEMKHFTPLHTLYYSSLVLTSEIANITWSSAFSHVYSELSDNDSIKLPKIIEFSLLENTKEFTLSNFVQELLDLVVLMYINPSNMISQ